MLGGRIFSSSPDGVAGLSFVISFEYRLEIGYTASSLITNGVLPKYCHLILVGS